MKRLNTRACYVKDTLFLASNYSSKITYNYIPLESGGCLLRKDSALAYIT